MALADGIATGPANAHQGSFSPSAVCLLRIGNLFFLYWEAEAQEINAALQRKSSQAGVIWFEPYRTLTFTSV